MCNKEITLSEKVELEDRLLYLYLLKAKSEGRIVHIIINPERYHKLKRPGKIYHDKDLYIFMDKERRQVLDMRPIVYHLIDTNEGLQYALFMHHEEYLQL